MRPVIMAHARIANPLPMMICSHVIREMNMGTVVTVCPPEAERARPLGSAHVCRDDLAAEANSKP